MLSACMIVRDEERYLGACLRSLRDVADEVVIVDTGSVDRSVEIARDHGATVHVRRWEEDFSYHRNQSLDLAHGDWALVIDGDEELLEPADLRALVERMPVDGIAVQVDCRTDTATVSTQSIRVFRREVGWYFYPVHNQLVGIGSWTSSPARILAHYEGGDRGDRRAKTERTKRMLLRLAAQRPSCPHAPYHLVRHYHAEGRDADADAWARRWSAITGRPAEIPAKSDRA